MPDQSGKVFAVTGGHAGIGLETTRGLAAKGATVYILSRTASKVEAAIKELEKDIPGVSSRLYHVQMDLLDLKGSRKAAADLKSKTSRLDGLVLNAGIMASPYKLTADGIEEQFQVNHLAQFALTRDLISLLQETAEKTGQNSRVVTLSSMGHRIVTSILPHVTPRYSTLEDVNRSFGLFGQWGRYGCAKTANILFARSLSDIKGITAIANHPGVVNSELYKHSISRFFKSAFISLKDGAISSLYAATAPEASELGGKFLVPFCHVEQPTKFASSDELRDQLWALSVKLVDEKTA